MKRFIFKNDLPSVLLVDCPPSAARFCEYTKGNTQKTTNEAGDNERRTDQSQRWRFETLEY